MAKLKVINSVKSIFLVITVLFLFSCRPNPASQWRGPERNGIFHETGLLQEWPENGPELLWRYDSLMMGHSSPVVTDEAIYITGMPDSTSGYLFCLSHGGELLWKELYGEEYKANYTGSRATPAVAGNLLYLESGFGEVICFDLKTQNKSWSFQMKENFGVDPVNYGNAESLLIHKNKLFCTPGGKDQSIVCLDRFSGDIIWKAEGTGENASYSSPIFVDHGGQEMIVAVLENSIIGVDAQSGQILWTAPFVAVYINHANTPIYHDGMIYMSGEAGEGKGGVIALELSPDGKQAFVKWQRTDIPSHLSGMIVQNNALYTCGGRREPWHCLNTQTGETIYTWDDYQYGNISFADKRFYILVNLGEVLLCEGNAQEFNVISRFKTGINIYDPYFAPLWAFPVIYNKKLYIRHQETLFVYNIAEGKNSN